MLDTADQPAKPVRTWRPMIFWSAGLVLVLGLVWFVAAVVVPVWQVRRHVQHCYQAEFPEEARVSAIEQLGGHGTAVRKISLYLRMPERVAPHKAVAVSLYGYCGSEAVDELLPLLSIPEMQSTAALAIGKIGPEARVAVPGLMLLLSSKDVWARLHSAEALYRITGDVGSVRSLLIEIVEDSDIAISAEGIRVLSSMGTKGIPVAVRGFASENWKARAALADVVVYAGRSDPVVVEILAKALKDPNPFIRCCCAGCLGRIGRGNRETNERLMSLLDDEQPYVRRVTAEALGQLGVAGSKAQLEALLSDKDETVRQAAAEALKKIRGEEPPK